MPGVRWVAGACLLGALVAGGVAWRARASHSIVAAEGTAPPTHALVAGPFSGSPAPAMPAVLAGGGDPVSVSLEAPAPDPAPALPMPDPSALVSAFARPKELQIPAAPVVAPAIPEHASADDLLERARRARRAGHIDDAVALFAAAVAKAPRDSEALTGLAEANEAQGSTSSAIALYRRALAVNPRYQPARLGLADSLWESGQRDEARGVYRTIVAQFPTSLCPDRARERAAGGAGSDQSPR